MIRVSPVKVGERSAVGLRVELPGSPPLLLVIGNKGFVMCGYLNVEVAEKV